MYTFDYQRPGQADAAVAALTANGDAKFLAGGQSLLPTMRLRLAQPSALVDVTRIASMKEIRVSGDTVTIGGAVCHALVAANADVKKALPGLADLAGHIGDRQVRERGTIGGSLANDDPGRVLSVRRARAERDGDHRPPPHRRRRLLRRHVRDRARTRRTDHRRRVSAAERAGYEKFRNPASHFALVGVFVAKRAARTACASR